LVDFLGGTVLAIGFVILPTKYETCEVLGSALQGRRFLRGKIEATMPTWR
jgi:hypothetical protein